MKPIINDNINDKKYDKNWLFLVANRVGKENNVIKSMSKIFNTEFTYFCGCSAAVNINPINILSCLDK